MHLVFCLRGLPSLPLDLGRERGVEVPLGCRLGRAPAFSFSFGSGAKWELPARCRLPFPAPPSSLSLPNSHRTFHDVRIRGRLRSLATACYPPVVLDLRFVEHGRIRGPGHVGVARGCPLWLSLSLLFPFAVKRSRASAPVVVRLALFSCPLAPGAVAVF